MKQLNPRFCPTSLQAQAGWFENFATQFAIVADALGFRNSVAAVNSDAAVVEKLAAIQTQLKAYRQAVRQYRITILTGDVGQPTPEFPALPTYGVPEVVPTGIYERMDTLIKQIKLAPTYTEEIGALLGIIPSNRPTPPPEDMQPTLKMVAMPGSSVQVTFVRGNTDGVMLQTKLDKAENWSDSGRYFTSPIELPIPENPTGLPRSVQVRARYIEGNAAVGQFSPVVSASTQPES
ncbi:MAG TPA: hypothetical protein PKA82_02050 [Pyrinomonadaceae bacterium]|nr:hypothetical protein [Pyrinomonadaceae bacterium]